MAISEAPFSAANIQSGPERVDAVGVNVGVGRGGDGRGWLCRPGELLETGARQRSELNLRRAHWS